MIEIGHHREGNCTYGRTWLAEVVDRRRLASVLMGEIEIVRLSVVDVLTVSST